MEGTIGEIKMFAGNFAPRTWAFCEGQLLSIAENNALFAIINTIYGGDGRTTMALPDLRGRAPIGVGQGPGLPYFRLGESSGTMQHTMTINEMPNHTHTAQAAGGAGSLSGTATAAMKVNNTEAGENTPSGGYLGKCSSELYIEEATANTLAADAITVDTSGLSVDVSGINIAVDHSGSGLAFGIMQPYIPMHYIICLQGVFPSRN
ncbi:MAG: phage tail protein [Bacteroidetes bacterium]|nr:phage tail protein [Bacteroidota bacterium]